MTGQLTVDVNGVRVDSISRSDAVDRLIQQSAQRSAGRYVCLLNAHLVGEATRNAELEEALRRSYLNLADGVPVAWLSRLLGSNMTSNIRGADLMADLCHQGVEHSLRHVLYGSTPIVLERLREQLKERFPGILICDAISPPFRELTQDEQEETHLRINTSNPDILWIGLGAPKQEIWALRHASKTSAAVTIAVGAAFDFHAQTKQQAPRWMQRWGLEWFYRLCQEPVRLTPRYVIGNFRFLVVAARCLLLQRRFRR